MPAPIKKYSEEAFIAYAINRSISNILIRNIDPSKNVSEEDIIAHNNTIHINNPKGLENCEKFITLNFGLAYTSKDIKVKDDSRIDEGWKTKLQPSGKSKTFHILPNLVNRGWDIQEIFREPMKETWRMLYQSTFGQCFNLFVEAEDKEKHLLTFLTDNEDEACKCEECGGELTKERLLEIIKEKDEEIKKKDEELKELKELVSNCQDEIESTEDALFKAHKIVKFYQKKIEEAQNPPEYEE